MKGWKGPIFNGPKRIGIIKDTKNAGIVKKSGQVVGDQISRVRIFNLPQKKI